MPCIAKLKITNLVNGEKVTDFLPILQVPNADVTLDLIAEAILKLDKETRAKIAGALREAKVLNLTEDDIKNHQFVSNTTLNGLQEEYPELKLMYPNFKTEENLTIVKAYKIKLNGNNYFGRVIDAAGKEIYIINGLWGALKLFKYLDVKNKIKQAISDKSLKNKIKDNLEDLNSIANKYEKSVEELLMDFLDDKKLFKPFKLDNGKSIIPLKVLNIVYSKIENSYNSAYDKSDLQFLLENLNKEEKNKFVYRINLNSLYDALSLDLKSLPSKEDWNNNDIAIDYLKVLLGTDIRLLKAKISIIGGEQKISDYKSLNEKEIKTFWLAFKKSHNDIEYETYGQLIKLAKTNPSLAISRLELAFPNSKVSFSDDLFTVLQPIYKSKVVKLSEKEIKAQLGSLYKKKLKSNPKDVLKVAKMAFPKNYNILLVDGNLEISYDENVYKPKEVIIKFPITTLGETYDFGYDSQYLFSPVNAEGVEKGKYHGAYIYEYRKGNSAHYVISRSIISPNSYAYTYNTLEGAKAKIDNWNDTLIIANNSLYTLKTYNYIPRVSFIESQNIKEGQILTTLDLKLPHISKFTGIFLDALSSTVPNFKEIFKTIPNIKSIETPELAAAFIYLFYKYLKDLNSTKNLNDLILLSRNKGAEIVNNILNAPTKSYFIENLDGKLATLKLLKDNGNDIDITGKFRNKNGNLDAANKLSIADMESAINYFNKKLGISIKTITLSELNKLAKDNKFNSKGVRAFILNGLIYINSSNANITDLFHELSHIFLGTLKVNDFESYQRVINKYANSKWFARTRTNIENAYLNFAEQDIMEECVADLIAEELTKNQGLAESFKGEEFSELFANIFSDFKEILTNKDDNGLAFNTIFNANAFNRNTRLTTFIKDNIENGKITEFGCI